MINSLLTRVFGSRNERLLNYFVLCSFMAIVLFPPLLFPSIQTGH